MRVLLSGKGDCCQGSELPARSYRGLGASLWPGPPLPPLALSLDCCDRNKGGARFAARTDGLNGKLLIRHYGMHNQPAIAQLAEHLTVAMAGIRWSLVRFRVAGSFPRAFGDEVGVATKTKLLTGLAFWVGGWWHLCLALAGGHLAAQTVMCLSFLATISWLLGLVV